jgi:hypothetical protein
LLTAAIYAAAPVQVRTQPMPLSVAGLDGVEQDRTHGMNTLTMWDERLVTVSEQGVPHNIVPGANRAFVSDPNLVLH